MSVYRPVDHRLLLEADTGLSSWIASKRSTRIPIHMFHCAVRVVGMRVDVEEVAALGAVRYGPG